MSFRFGSVCSIEFDDDVFLTKRTKKKSYLVIFSPVRRDTGLRLSVCFTRRCRHRTFSLILFNCFVRFLFDFSKFSSFVVEKRNNETEFTVCITNFLSLSLSYYLFDSKRKKKGGNSVRTRQRLQRRRSMREKLVDPRLR